MKKITDKRSNLMWTNQSWQMLQMKTTSNRRGPQNISCVISQRPLLRNSKLKLIGPSQVLQMLQMKTTSNTRQPQYEKCGISYSNFKLKFMWQNQSLQMPNWRWPITPIISQQPRIGSYSSFRFKLMWPNQSVISQSPLLRSY